MTVSFQDASQKMLDDGSCAFFESKESIFLMGPLHRSSVIVVICLNFSSLVKFWYVFTRVVARIFSLEF